MWTVSGSAASCSRAAKAGDGLVGVVASPVEPAVHSPLDPQAPLRQGRDPEPIDGGTRVTSYYRGESRGFFKVAEPLVIRLGKKHFETAWENLRTLMEDHAL